jgi:SAM-dependent methyltransferase
MTPDHDRLVAEEELRVKEVYAARDRRAQPYSFFGRGHLFLLQSLEREILKILSRAGWTDEVLGRAKILEVGCGAGFWLREFVKWGARPEHLFGVDILPERVATARRLSPPGVSVTCENAARLSFADASFDLVLQATVFTSVLDASVRARLAGEMVRVLKPDGIILWYDYFVRKPGVTGVRAIRRREIGRLFAGCDVRLRRATLAPPIARLVAPHAWWACALLEQVSLLRTHYLGVIRRHA